MQSKHRKQMSPAEIRYTETLVHGMTGWRFERDHMALRMAQKGVSEKDATLALKWGAVIRVQDDGRVLLRQVICGKGAVCVVADLVSRKMVTAWRNDSTDNHATLDMSEYTLKTNVITYLEGLQ